MTRCRTTVTSAAVLATLTCSVAAAPGTFNLPPTFIENQGQWDDAAKFVVRLGGLTARIETDGITIRLASRDDDGRVRAAVTRFVFEGAAATAQIVGVDRLRGRTSFFVGNDRSKWRTDVPSYDHVVYRGLYDGIDIRVHVSSGQLEYDLLLAPGVDPDRVVIRCEGGSGLDIDNDGVLVMQTVVGTLRQMPPTTWHDQPGGRQPVASRFCLVDDTRYGFEVPDRRADCALVIDPKLEYSTFLGGSNSDNVRFPNGLIVDGSGRLVVSGRTFSGDFPMVSAYDAGYNSSGDAFVAVLDPSLSGNAQLVYSTFLGGNFEDAGDAVAVDDQGRIHVSGQTQSANFPTTPGAYDTTLDGDWDAYLVILDPNEAGAAQLVYGTYLGGSDIDYASDLVIEASGAVIVLGSTRSQADFPTTPGAYDETPNGNYDVFLSRIDPFARGSAQLVNSTYVGGFGNDFFKHVAVDDAGIITIAGDVQSSNFPATPGAWDTTYNGGFRDAAIAKFDSALSTLLYATYFGGTGDENGNAMDVDASGNVTISGWSDSFNLPFTIDAYDTTANGGFDVYVARLDATLSTVLACTYVGGSADDGANGLDLDTAGNVTVTGVANSTDFPTTDAGISDANAGAADTLVARFDPALTTLRYSTYFGGVNNDFGYVVFDDESGAATVGGLTASFDFPTTPDAFDQALSGVDAYVTRLKFCPWDCDGSNDGIVGIVDFLAVLAQWDMVGTSCDIDGDGVGIVDFLDLLAHWGVCP